MLDSPLFSAGQHWALWAILFSAAAFGLWAEKTRFGSRLSAVVIAILTTFVLSNLSIIPTDAPAYDVVWSYAVPLAIPLLLFKANLRKIINEAGPTLVAFLFGAVGTMLGTIIAFYFISIGEEGWRLAGIFCATYIGGSMNFVAASEALGMMKGDLLTAGVAADNLVMTLYFLLLFALPSIKILKKVYPTEHDKNAGTVIQNKSQTADVKKLEVLDIGSALAIAAVCSAVGFGFENLIRLKGTGILFITALVVLLATVFPKKLSNINGADQIGTFLMQVFFAVIGASANISIVLKVGPILFLFAAVILTVHLIFILTAGKLFKLDLAEIIIASNANMGGPTTAAAMAVARRWDVLVIPAILCGTLGYAIATFIGTAVGHLLK